MGSAESPQGQMVECPTEGGKSSGILCFGFFGVWFPCLYESNGKPFEQETDTL